MHCIYQLENQVIKGFYSLVYRKPVAGGYQKERGSGALAFRSAKLTECLALPERRLASAMVLTKLNLTNWCIKKEVLAFSQKLHKRYNQAIATLSIPSFPGVQCF